jgi:hypothetical protein
MSTTKNFKLKKTLPLWGVLMVLLVFSCQDLNLEDKLDEVAVPDNLTSNLVPGRYIVTLHSNEINFRKSDKYEDVQSSMRKIASEMLVRYNIEPEKVKAVYGHALSGFTVELTDDEYRMLRKNPKIKSIEQDSYILDSYNQMPSKYSNLASVEQDSDVLDAFNQRQTPPGKDKPKDDGGGDGGTEPSDPDPTDPSDGGIIQNDAPKYLDRINQRNLPLDNIYSYNSSGTGVNVYIPGFFIVDVPGELDGRIVNIDIIQENKNYDEPNKAITEKALLVGGTTFGPAKNVTLFGLQVYREISNSPEFISELISAYDWILANGEAPGIVVTQLVRETQNSTYFESLEKLYHAGFSLFTSAGGWAEDACTWASSYSPYVFTVGMARIDDTKGVSSNYGDCVDLFTTTTDWRTGPDNYTESWTDETIMNPNFIAGSVAAGIAAKYLEGNPNASPEEVYQFLRSTSTKNKVRFSNSVNNHLLYSGMTMEGAGIIDPNRVNYTLDLEGTNRKIRGNDYQVELKWNPIILQTGSQIEPIDLFENGNLIGTFQDCIGCFEHQIIYRINVSGRNLPPRTYKICLSGTNKCSNEVTLTF